jgi:2-polyprenyl-6-methoxyphenol hydroxylase-like FAD-dependent oxidoreductase
MYDAIIVGARCAGSPTAMLLARKGWRALLLDKASFPSDTMSTHFIHPPGVARLERWGLLDRVRDAGTPPINKMTLGIGGAVMEQQPVAADGTPASALCPRRTVLDKLLVDAAIEAGAELRENFSVREILIDGERVTGVRGEHNGATVQEDAKIVIGADGMHSIVAKTVGAEEYNTLPSLSFGYYAYWSGLKTDGGEIHMGDGAGVLVFPTNDGMTCVAVGGGVEGFHEFRKDIEGNYQRVVEGIASLGERMRSAKRETKFIGTADQPNFFRKPYGPGWALVGDAGYHRDFITGLGITDAFRDADLIAAAVDDGLAGRRPIEEALAGYERERNEIATPLFEFTTSLARLAGPPTPELFLSFATAMSKT